MKKRFKLSLKIYGKQTLLTKNLHNLAYRVDKTEFLKTLPKKVALSLSPA